MAGGTEVVLGTDLVVASTTARFGIPPEVKRGLVAAGGGLLRLPHRIPYQKAFELALTGETFTAEQGEHGGASSTSSPNPARRWPGAIELAGKISANGPLAVAATKDVLLQSADWSRAEMWKKQMELIIPVFSSNDAREGAVAFAEKKRVPNWTGT